MGICPNMPLFLRGWGNLYGRLSRRASELRLSIRFGWPSSNGVTARYATGAGQEYGSVHDDVCAGQSVGGAAHVIEAQVRLRTAAAHKNQSKANETRIGLFKKLRSSRAISAGRSAILQALHDAARQHAVKDHCPAAHILNHDINHSEIISRASKFRLQISCLCQADKLVASLL